RRPSEIIDAHGSKRELHSFGAVHATPNESTFRIGHVSHPLAVTRKIQLIAGNALKVRLILARARVIAHQLAVRLGSHGIDRLAVAAGCGQMEIKNAIRQLYRLGTVSMEYVHLIPQRPDVSLAALKAGKEVVAPVAGPLPRPSSGRTAPT